VIEKNEDTINKQRKIGRKRKKDRRKGRKKKERTVIRKEGEMN
jgi:hypothetical protein